MHPDSWGLLAQVQLCSLLCSFIPLYLSPVIAHAEGKADDKTGLKREGKKFSPTNSKKKRSAEICFVVVCFGLVFIKLLV